MIPGLTLTVPAGQITGLLGPSGCGKSTLMRSMVGVQIVAGGSISVLGRPAGSPDLRRRVGYVTQAPSVYLDLTVRQNLNYFARVLGVDRDRVADVLETVDMTARADQLGGTLSGGELSRASLAVALLSEPEVLVLDEPTVGLDPVLRKSLWAMFRSLATRGVTLLVSTHVMDEADRCDQLVLMHDGAVIAADAPDAVIRNTGAADLENAFIQLAEAAK